jgi:O-antigen/teichoic acid export membrane protein
VIRRSLLVGAVFVLGHLFHYALMLAANRILDPGTFGRFYTAISLLNVLLTPATVLSFMFAQHFSTVFSAAGAGAVVGELRLLLRQHLAGGGLAGLAGTLALLLVAAFLGANALMLLVLVPGVALAVYLFELSRAALQGMLDFVLYSAFWIGWRAFQFVLALVALFLTGAAWAGMAGILVATVLSTVLLLALVLRRGTAEATPASPEPGWPPFRVAPALPFAAEYGFFVLVTNLDILIAYLVLPNDALGAYSATSLLPKAIVTATQPVSQVMLPVMNLSGSEVNLRRAAMLKAVLACAVLAAAGAGVLWLGGDVACNDRYGIRFCSPGLLALLGLAAIPLAVLRVLVVGGLALRGQRQVILCAAALVAFTVLMLVRVGSITELAVTYLAFCWLFTALYAGAMLWKRRALLEEFGLTRR